MPTVLERGDELVAVVVMALLDMLVVEYVMRGEHNERNLHMHRTPALIERQAFDTPTNARRTVHVLTTNMSTYSHFNNIIVRSISKTTTSTSLANDADR